MPHTAWPVYTDVETLIAGIPNATSPSNADCTDIISAVVSDFESRTGRIPFLASGSDTTRYFDPPDGRDKRVELDVQLYTFTSLTVGYSPTSSGTVYALNKDFQLSDVNAPALGKPYERINFLSDPGYLPQSVIVVGDWGWGINIPYDAWRGVLRQSVALALEQTMPLSGPVKEEKVGIVTRQYGIRGQKTIIDDFHDEYEAVVTRYTFISGH